MLFKLCYKCAKSSLVFQQINFNIIGKTIASCQLIQITSPSNNYITGRRFHDYMPSSSGTSLLGTYIAEKSYLKNERVKTIQHLN